MVSPFVSVIWDLLKPKKTCIINLQKPLSRGSDSSEVQIRKTHWAGSILMFLEEILQPQQVPHKNSDAEKKSIYSHIDTYLCF